MSMTGKAAGRMHILFHGSFQDLTVLFHSGQERDQSPVSPIMKKAVSKHSVADQNLNISAPDHVEMQSSCRACLSCRSLRIKFLASLFTVKLFIFLYSTMICQNRNPNLFLGIPWWPNKFSFELFSLPHSTDFPPLCTIQGFCHVWMMLFVQEYLNRAWIDTGTLLSTCVHLLIHFLCVSGTWCSRQNIPVHGVSTVLWNRNQIHRLTVGIDLLPAGNVEVSLCPLWSKGGNFKVSAVQATQLIPQKCANLD